LALIILQPLLFSDLIFRGSSDAQIARQYMKALSAALKSAGGSNTMLATGLWLSLTKK